MRRTRHPREAAGEPGLYPVYRAEHRSPNRVKPAGDRPGMACPRLRVRTTRRRAPIRARSAGNRDSGAAVGAPFLSLVSFGETKESNTSYGGGTPPNNSARSAPFPAPTTDFPTYVGYSALATTSPHQEVRAAGERRAAGCVARYPILF